jgi:site-specific recombinase XerD
MKQYNLYNLEATFKEFLISGNNSLSFISLKNYLSDFRHFSAWFFFKIKSLSNDVDRLDLSEVINKFFNKLLLAQYKAYLIENKIPVKTANRRLSTIRKLSKFFLSQGWTKDNPSREISNISVNLNLNQTKYYSHNISSNLVLNEYKRALESHNSNQEKIIKEVQNINEFFTFIS